MLEKNKVKGNISYRRAHKLLKYFNSFFLMLLTIWIGLMLIDAFTGGAKYTRQWWILLAIVFPLYALGHWAIDKNKEMEAKK